MQNVLNGLAKLLQLTAKGRRARRRSTVVKDLAYGHAFAGEQTLDLWRPRGPRPPGGLPLVVYVHGGGFGFCSKETHWLLAANLAARGFCVANLNYRRVPAHPVPAALADVALAIGYCQQRAASWGASTSGLVLMGESAGANLALAQALALAVPADRVPAWARELRASAPTIRALLPACGLLEVSDPGRFAALPRAIPAFVVARIAAVCRGYAPADPHGEAGLWASPLRLLEELEAPLAAFPPTWIGVGDADPILDDSLRLHRALAARGHATTLVRYPGKGHAFFALPHAAEDPTFWAAAAAFIQHGGQPRGSDALL